MGPAFLGFNLGFKMKFTDPKVTKVINPTVLIVHANPTCGSRVFTTTGITIPPVADPDAAIPSAKLFFF